MAWHAPGRLQRAWHDTPRLGVALRAAIAASVAWAVASLLPEPLAEYPYYAPFGAVIATTLSLAGSIRESIQAVSSIAIGGLIAWLVDLIPLPQPVAVGITVAVAVAAVAIPWLGAAGAWVPTAAIFTLIVGHGEGSFIGGYAGLTLLGAAVGVAVTAVFPPAAPSPGAPRDPKSP